VRQNSGIRWNSLAGQRNRQKWLVLRQKSHPKYLIQDPSKLFHTPCPTTIPADEI